MSYVRRLVNQKGLLDARNVMLQRESDELTMLIEKKLGAFSAGYHRAALWTEYAINAVCTCSGENPWMARSDEEIAHEILRRCFLV